MIIFTIIPSWPFFFLFFFFFADELLPMIHKVWEPLKQRFCDHNKLIVIKVSTCLCVCVFAYIRILQSVYCDWTDLLNLRRQWRHFTQCAVCVVTSSGNVWRKIFCQPCSISSSNSQLPGKAILLSIIALCVCVIACLHVSLCIYVCIYVGVHVCLQMNADILVLIMSFFQNSSFYVLTVRDLVQHINTRLIINCKKLCWQL